MTASWLEHGLGLCALALPPALALVPHAAAPLAGIAGLCAAALVAMRPPRDALELCYPAALLAALTFWAALTAAWSIDPWRSLVLDLRLGGLLTATLVLVAAAGRIGAPWRLTFVLLLGTGLAIAIALGDLASAGGLSRYVSVRAFRAPRLNQIAAWLTILALPAGALLVCRGRLLAGLATATAVAATVILLDDATAKIGLALSLPIAALVYLRRAAVTRIVAVMSAVVIVTAPLTLPGLARTPDLFAAVDALKDSAGHRLLIWSFAGDRIAEHPYAGWGLDSARTIPGGKDEIRPGQTWLPLHPHDAALQVWLELGAPGAALFALIIGLLWWRLGAAPWPRLYAAAAGGGLAAALFVAAAGWGIWQEWWLGTLGLALFAVLVMARASGAGPNDPIDER